MHSDENTLLFSKIYKKIGKKWGNFVQDIKMKADKDDQRQIFFKDFIEVI